MKDDKFFVIARVGRGKTEVEWRQLAGIRPFIERYLTLESQEGIAQKLSQALPPAEQIEGAIVRLVLEYPREWESLIDESALREHTAAAFEFQLIKRPQMEARIRLPDGQAVGSLTPLELLNTYWDANHVQADEKEALKNLAQNLIQEREEE